MNKIVIGNWKMNMLPSESVEFIKELDKNNFNNEVIILAPFINLPYLRSNKIKFGSQNVFYKNKGSYTGEISPLMLKDININYCLIGHFERRRYFNEDDNMILLKVKNAIEEGLTVILCVNSIERLKNNTLGIKDYNKLIVAFEPDDFIGGNKVVSKKVIDDFIIDAKKLLSNDIKVVYGGGITINNLDSIKEIDSLDGILIGNSSLNIDTFKEIIEKY